jgi:hypothetical protein
LQNTLPLHEKQKPGPESGAEQKATPMVTHRHRIGFVSECNGSYPARYFQ